MPLIRDELPDQVSEDACDGVVPSRPFRPLRVLHVIPSVAPRRGGTSKAVIEMCEALARRGDLVTVVTSNLDRQGGWLPFSRLNCLDVPVGVPVQRNGVEYRYFKVGWPARFVFSPMMGRYLRRNVADFDVVHVHSVFLYPTLAASRCARIAGVPYLIQPHGTFDPYLRQFRPVRKAIYLTLFEKHNMRRAAAIPYTSEQERLDSQAGGVSGSGVVVPLGLHAEEFAGLPPRGGFRAEHPEVGSRQLVVFLGRLTPKKGLDLLFPAFEAARRRCPDIHMIIAGPDDEGYGEVVHDLIRDLALEDHVTLTGMLVGDAKLRLLADTDVWVLPSRGENFGFAVLEAMACGLPVVISEGVNISEQVRAAGAGLVVPYRVKALSEALVSLLTDGRLGARLGAAAQRLVTVEYTWDRAAGDLERLYEEIRRLGPGESLHH